MKIDDQIEALYDEVGERCPFKVAKHLGIALYRYDLDDDICGIYKMKGSTPIIILNSNIHIEMEETTCYLLVKHHKSHYGIDFGLNRSELQVYERAESAQRKYLKKVTDTFLSFKINQWV